MNPYTGRKALLKPACVSTYPENMFIHLPGEREQYQEIIWADIISIFSSNIYIFSRRRIIHNYVSILEIIARQKPVFFQQIISVLIFISAWTVSGRRLFSIIGLLMQPLSKYCSQIRNNQYLRLIWNSPTWNVMNVLVVLKYLLISNIPNYWKIFTHLFCDYAL